MARMTVATLREKKKRNEKITMVTAYDFPSARMAEEAGLDTILVGDSLGMAVLGYETTLPVTMDEMIYHTRAVTRGAPNTFVVGDMPFLSYHRSLEETYPQYPPLTAVEVSGITEVLCGKSRHGHFKGVATVVIKLFNIVQPHRAYFGQKDYQQLLVIQQMVADLNIPVTIEPVPIKREEDGVAMSSRNAYLSAAERQEALALSQALQIGYNMYSNGERSVSTLIEAMKARILQEPSAVIDYVEIRHATTLAPLTEINGPAVVALAVRIGKTRLIDNLLLEG